MNGFVVRLDFISTPLFFHLKPFQKPIHLKQQTPKLDNNYRLSYGPTSTQRNDHADVDAVVNLFWFWVGC